MKFKGLIAVITLLIAASACSQNALQNVKVENDVDSLSYAIGVLNQASAAQSDIEINPMVMARGMQDAKNGKPMMDETAARGFVNSFMMKQEEDKAREQYKDVLEEGEAFLKDNAGKEGVMTTQSGLQYKVVSMGDGPKPASSDVVRVNYKGTLIDGTVFDSSYDRGEPAEFRLDGVIPGWTEGVQLMPVGSKFIFYVPSDLAYGARAAGSDIKPFSTLIFEVELLAIVSQDE